MSGPNCPFTKSIAMRKSRSDFAAHNLMHVKFNRCHITKCSKRYFNTFVNTLGSLPFISLDIFLDLLSKLSQHLIMCISGHMMVIEPRSEINGI